MAKPQIQVDKARLVAAIKQADGMGLTSLLEVWKKAAEIYNKTAEITISFSVVMLRAQAWEIQLQTKPGRRGKSKGKGNEIDADALTAAIEEVEKDGPLSNLGELWPKVVELYNKNSTYRLSVVLAKEAAKKLNINVKTQPGKKGKAKQEVDRNVLVESVRQAEKNGPLPSRGDLWPKVVEIYNKINPDNPITVSVAMLRVDEFEIETKTASSKRRVPREPEPVKPVVKSKEEPKEEPEEPEEEEEPKQELKPTVAWKFDWFGAVVMHMSSYDFEISKEDAEALVEKNREELERMRYDRLGRPVLASKVAKQLGEKYKLKPKNK